MLLQLPGEQTILEKVALLMFYLFIYLFIYWFKNNTSF